MPKPVRDHSAWQAFVRRHLDATGLRQNEVTERSDGEISTSMMSNWYGGRSGAEVEAAVLFATIVKAPVQEALHAAGYPRLAHIVSPSADDGADLEVKKILSNPVLTDEDKEDLLMIHRRRVVRLEEELRIALAERVKTRQSENN